MALRRTVFGKKEIGSLYEPNTFIGGVGGNSVNSVNDLASILEISVDIIPYFQIVGNDVEAFISESWTAPTNMFSSDANISYFIDLDILMNLGNSMFRYTNIEVIYTPRERPIAYTNQGTRDVNSLKFFNFKGLKKIDAYIINSNTCPLYEFDNAEVLGPFPFYVGSRDAEVMYLPLATSWADDNRVFNSFTGRISLNPDLEFFIHASMENSGNI